MITTGLLEAVFGRGVLLYCGTVRKATSVASGTEVQRKDLFGALARLLPVFTEPTERTAPQSVMTPHFKESATKVLFACVSGYKQFKK